MNRKSAFLGCALLLLFTLLTSSAFAGGYLTWPTDGEVITPFSSGEHRGIDISAAVGSRITAAEEGVVYWVGRTPRGEPCVSIDHPDGRSTSYLPVETSVVKGQKVARSAVIGVLSADGDPSSNEPHLHLGLFETSTRDDKRYLNPQDYLMARLVEPASDIQPAPAAELASPRAGAEAPRIVETQVERSAVTQSVVAAVGLPAAATASSVGVAPQAVIPEQQFSRMPQTSSSGQRQIVVPSTTIQLAELPSSAAVLASVKTQAAQGVSGEAAQVLPAVPAAPKSASTAYTGQLEQAASAGFASNYQVSELPQNASQALPNIVVSGAAQAGLASAKSQQIKELQTTSTRVGPNPFRAEGADVQAARPPASVTAGQTDDTARSSTASNRAIFESSILPDMVLAFALTLIITVSFRFARRVKKQALAVLAESPTATAFAA